MEQSTDKHSKMLIASNIELFPNYCTGCTTAFMSLGIIETKGIQKNLRNW